MSIPSPSDKLEIIVNLSLNLTCQSISKLYVSKNFKADITHVYRAIETSRNLSDNMKQAVDSRDRTISVFHYGNLLIAMIFDKRIRITDLDMRQALTAR